MEEIFDYAMKMEQDGKAYYQATAKETSEPALKKILVELAEDEDRHYDIFKAMKEHHTKNLSGLSKKDTNIIGSTKNLFEKLARKKGHFEFSKGVIEVWKKAQEIEKKSEDFYRSKATEVADAEIKALLKKIANEERKHWATIESVLRFMDKPQTWLENAEWNHLDEY